MFKQLLFSLAIVAAMASSSFAGMMTFRVDLQAGSARLDTVVLVQDYMGDLKFTLTVDSTTNSPYNIGDLRGIWFDVADESLVPGLSVSGMDITTSIFDANNVTNVGPGNNVNPMGPFDAGMEIGTPGMSENDIQTTMFVLSHSSALSAESFFRVSGGENDYVMAVRGTSVGPVGSARGGSSKTGNAGASGGSFNPVPEPASALIWGLLGLTGMSVRRKRS